MFNTFRSGNDSELGADLAKQAKIEAVLTDGEISSLAVIVSGKWKSTSKKFNSVDFRKSFVGIIEERIANEDYINPIATILKEDYLHKVEYKTSSAFRFVCTQALKPIWRWTMEN